MRSCRPLFLLAVSLFLLSACNDTKEHENEPVAETNDTTTIVRNDLIVNPYAPPDISPMDMSYLPTDYPQLKMTHSITTPPVARVIYSRPHREGRVIFGQLVKYGEPWRLGANEATEIDFFQNVSIENKKVIAGRYILYAIPEEQNWTVVLNKNIDTWGLQIDSTKDVMRFSAPVTIMDSPVEFFTIVFRKTDSGANLLMMWDNVKATLPISF